MSNPVWFNETHFARQKAGQMNALAWPDAQGEPKTDWTAEDWPGALAHYNSTHNTAFTAFDNFVVCNCKDYASYIQLGEVNVSPNALFDIPVYLTNLANHYNQTGFSAPGYASGQWTALKALHHLFENEHISAWEHFKSYGLVNRINPSNEFDTAAYLADRAAAMGTGYTEADAVAVLQREGVNPLQDYFLWGRAHGLEPLAVTQKVDAGIAESAVWGATSPDDDSGDTGNGGGNPGDDNPPFQGGSGNGGANPPSQGGNGKPDEPSGQPELPVNRDEPYDHASSVVELDGSGTAIGETGESTLFTGAYSGENGGSLTPDAIITGGADAANSLVVDLSASWPGFDGITADGETMPSVSNVGRVVLNNSAADAQNLNFKAANISDALEQIDINNADKGAISLSALPASVKTINIENLTPDDKDAAPATEIAFEAAPATLRLGLENVCADSGAAPIKIQSVPNLEIASYGLNNAIDLKSSTDIRKLVIADGASVTIADSPGASIEEYDASAATRSVNIGVSGFRDSTVVKGGQGADVLTFVDYAGINSANWSDIEELVFRDGADVNAAGVEGVRKITMDSPYEVNVAGLETEELTVLLTANAEQGKARSCAKGVVEGSIGDLVWSSHGVKAAGSELTADFVCNATGDALIKLEGRDRLGVSSVFEFHDLQGTITIDDPNPTAAGAYNNPAIEGVKLLAEQATGLKIMHAGSMKICGALWKVADVDAVLTDTMDGNVNGIFKLPELPSAQNVEINPDRMDVYISGLGSQNTGAGMELFIHDAGDVFIGHIREAERAAPVNAIIDSFGDVEIGEIKTGGDLNLHVSGVNIAASQNDYGVNDGFTGANVDLDFGNVHGNVGSGTMFIDLEALGGSLNYTGARGSDNLLIGGLTGGTNSFVNTGAGDDELVIQTLDSIGYGKTAVLDINPGAGADILRVFSMNQEGNLIVNVLGGDYAGKTISYDCPFNMKITSADAANAALAILDAGFRLAQGTEVNDGVFEYGGNAYWIGNRHDSNGTNVTLVAAMGADASIFTPDDLVGE